jgi:hypothetical protein
MPVTFSPSMQVAPRPGNRKAHFDARVRELAPLIQQHRTDHQSIEQLANRLNEVGIPAPNGGLFTYSTLRRILVRIRELRLGPGPRNGSTAATERPTRDYFRRSKRMRARRARAVLNGQSMATRGNSDC